MIDLVYPFSVWHATNLEFYPNANSSYVEHLEKQKNSLY